MTRLEIDADRALFEGPIEGMVLACYENERPLQGLAGLFDWRFLGTISRCIRAGVITGRAGECAYVPVTRDGRVFHLLLAGAGSLASDGKRGALPEATITALKKNLAGLRTGERIKVGMSVSDVGGSGPEFLEKKFKGVPLWIVP